VRAFLLGLLLLLVVAVSVLSLRPGGLRNQLRNVVRRLKLALALFGVYLVVSTVVRLAFPSSTWADVAMALVGAGLGLSFLVLGQDRQLFG
jgi:hypothetical protein